MITESAELEIIQQERPLFLKVLCILTFIGSGYGVINAAVAYFKADDISKIAIEAIHEVETKKKAKHPESDIFLNKITKNVSVITTPENLRKNSMSIFSTSILCLLGAFVMWHLRKIGFYVYTLGTIIGIVIPFYLYGNNFLTNISAGFLGYVGILFVIFYGMNLKSMK